MPSFYFRPETMAEAATSYGWRVMDQLGIEVAGRKRWGKE
jgi:4-hydroxy-3-polyprenylbenzoate decarboxylase